jgi:hypothetical protein
VGFLGGLDRVQQAVEGRGVLVERGDHPPEGGIDPCPVDAIQRLEIALDLTRQLLPLRTMDGAHFDVGATVTDPDAPMRPTGRVELPAGRGYLAGAGGAGLTD